MSDLPIITVTSLTPNPDGTGFANAEQVPDDLPQWVKCNDCNVRWPDTGTVFHASDHDLSFDGPCPFDAVLRRVVPSDHDGGTGYFDDRTATVTVLHHADECRGWTGPDAPRPYREGEDNRAVISRTYCHPEALPGQWHLTFKETGE